MRKIVAIGVALLLAIGLIFYYHQGPETLQFATQPVSRGTVEETVGATGTLEAVTTVQVGTQVSGTIQELRADFNTPVRKGQIIARLDTSLIQTQIDQARANLERAEADLDRLRVAETDAFRKHERASMLAADGLITASEAETAEANYKTAGSQVRSAEAQVTQARASLNQAVVNLDKTVITAPITGIVIARNVDVGQTVAASFQSPTLFTIAADLTKMRVNASVNEADIGRVRPGQPVRFQVDAYQGQEFTGTVSVVRLNAITQQNVVTYATVIDVPNPDMKLKPGMTATVTIQIARAANVLRVPNAALRFRPTKDMFAALNQPEPVLPAPAPSSGPNPPSEGPGRGKEPEHPDSSSPGHLWTFENGMLVPHSVVLGITDGAYTELRQTALQEGSRVVTGVQTGGEQPSSSSSTTTNPLLPTRPRGPKGP